LAAALEPFARPLDREAVPAAAGRCLDLASVELVSSRACRHVRELGEYRAKLLGTGERFGLCLVRLRVAAAELDTPQSGKRGTLQVPLRHWPEHAGL
jgi:hypothetical protein